MSARTLAASLLAVLAAATTVACGDAEEKTPSWGCVPVAVPGGEVMSCLQSTSSAPVLGDSTFDLCEGRRTPRTAPNTSAKRATRTALRRARAVAARLLHRRQRRLRARAPRPAAMMARARVRVAPRH